MYKKIIEYTDYNGTVRKEPFYFNLTKAEITRYAYSVDGEKGLQSRLTRLIATQKSAELWKEFEGLIAMSYGVKSDDGKMFIKNPKVLEEFQQSEAYSEFIMELIGRPGAANEFIEGIMPSAVIAQMANKLKDENAQQQMVDELIEGKDLEADGTVISGAKGE
jgi:hypothetical protein